jgi:hypothetical protein
MMGDPLHTILTERLGCRWPIIQTAMGSLSPALSSAARTRAPSVSSVQR